jgi:hypothetical protein
MVFEGLTRPEAAKSVEMTDHGLREALRKPHVLRYLRECKEVLRTSAGARALRTIEELSDGANSEKVKLEAAIYLDSGQHRRSDGHTNVTVGIGIQVTPGYVIDNSEPAEIEPLTIDAEPMGETDQAPALP